MAINPKNDLSPDHWFICGGTGSGKTSILRVELKNWHFKYNVIWDPEEDHHAHHLHSLVAYKRELRTAIASGQRYRLALTVEPTPENFEAWCKIVWDQADGNVRTGVYIEEIADVCGAGKAIGHHGQIMRKGRKYNLHTRSVSQRPQECPKTVISMCQYKWCGRLENLADVKVMAGHLGIEQQQLIAMPENIPKRKLHYWIKKPGELSATLGHFNPAR